MTQRRSARSIRIAIAIAVNVVSATHAGFTHAVEHYG